jgi:glyoxylase-like metal-dependent hydrolase (beta-lactamase superfamily II)
MRIKRVVIGAVVAVALALVVPMALYMVASTRASADFTPLATGTVADGVVAIRDGYVNSWAFKAGDSWILFDSGMNAKRLLAGLASVGIEPGSVSALFLTHTDYDHVGAAGRFSNAAVYISDRERLMVNGTVRRAFIFHNRLRVPYRTVRDGETVTVGPRSVTAFVTPGPTVGSACYLVDGAYLVAGDSMAIRSGKIGTFSDFFNMDTATQRVSIKNLFARSELDGRLRYSPGIMAFCGIIAWRDS